ncbi:uncharacterized protein BCR38DRAFT_472973 [Pseudomassariella vexata]|uniref:Uncharacterized protein n=1 Tax=Pseudomassariella vexata TaxID=1141098 RepID=A0A1Y2E7U0_9PEZI|nr:uncharacterized protein BCR38DRAFT_472973 [Pseudomassariella vexata]ORY67610.1 hypothetical protein BCR38DRAFT_472973 [Pseudomassariella vexata]
MPALDLSKLKDSPRALVLSRLLPRGLEVGSSAGAASPLGPQCFRRSMVAWLVQLNFASESTLNSPAIHIFHVVTIPASEFPTTEPTKHHSQHPHTLNVLIHQKLDRSFLELVPSQARNSLSAARASLGFCDTTAPSPGFHHSGGGATAELSELKPQTSYDRHDFYEPHTSTEYQRQQHHLLYQTPPPQTPEQRSTTSSRHRVLRRTPRFSATPSPKPAEPPSQQPAQAPARVTITLGPRGQYILSGAEQGEQPRTRRRQARRQLSQDLSSEDLEDNSPQPPSRYHHASRTPVDPKQPTPHLAVHISKHTHSAILYALEATLRGPQELSSDPIEELASMADLMQGGGLATSNGNGGSSRPTTARAPIGSPSSGIRGPRMIMQERAAREARQREERERLDREHAEAEQAEQRMLEETRRREERANAAAGAGVPGAGAMPPGADPSAIRRAAAGALPGRATSDIGGRVPGSSRPPADTQAQASQRHTRTTSAQGVPATAVPGATAAGSSGTQQLRGSEPQTAESRGRNSFPHAFERWETLSAHWEGLTSFWIRRLQQNTDEIDNDPLSQQLSRQVTDLSSAGANLFHAVVELQRLRASSERKFQRWFFDTRAEMERNQEVTAMLESALEEERRSRADAIREALEHEQGSSRIQKQLSEMRKELTISKEEARRAWEELGRREQEERDRTLSLQQGQPTIVGGVQVVPMTQGVSRHNSQRDNRTYGQAESDGYVHAQQTATSRAEYSQAPAVQPVVTSSGGNPTHQQSVHHQGSYGSEGAYSEGEYSIDAYGNFARDSRGDKIPFRAPASDDNSDAGPEDFETPASQPGGHHPTSTGAHAQQPQYSSAPDYAGSGYTAPGWESLPRHHHPTRLSDVIEEDDERSRTSASQSQISRV